MVIEVDNSNDPLFLYFNTMCFVNLPETKMERDISIGNSMNMASANYYLQWLYCS